MREHRLKILIIALLVVVVGVPFLLRPSSSSPTTAPRSAMARLIVMTPHNEQIRHEFSTAFNAWRTKGGLAPIEFDWRASGGTSDLRKQVLAQFEAAAARGHEHDGIGVDLFFGGGEYDHNRLARGITIWRHDQDTRISASIRPQLPAGLLEQVFPEPTIGGERLYREDLHWVGVVLASFGIVYNRDVVSMLDLPEPQTWADLGDSRYRGWIALADPGHSSSIAATYNAILRRHGWTEGWALLRRVFANARYFAVSSSKVPVDVSAGEAAAGMCIDFYGRFQAGAIGDRVGYVDPLFMTATTADPISILRGAPHLELAGQFVQWLLSIEGQQLWQRRAHAPNGPTQYELRRQPIRRDLYHPAEKAHWTDPQIDPFATARPFPEGMPSFFGMVAPVAHAMAIDIHDNLTAAWAALQRTPSGHRHKPEMYLLFDAMPASLTLNWPDPELAETWADALRSPSNARHEEVAAVLGSFVDSFGDRYAGRRNGDRLLRDRLRWTLFFRDNYRRIVRLARQM